MEENPYDDAGQLLPSVYKEEMHRTVDGSTFTTFVPL